MAILIAIAFLFRHDHGLFLGMAAAVSLALASLAEGWRQATSRFALMIAVTIFSAGV